MKGTLTKVHSTHKNLRTDTIEGWFDRMPTVGEPFLFKAPPLERGNIRMIFTTAVEHLRQIEIDGLLITTKNSVYHLKYEP